MVPGGVIQREDWLEGTVDNRKVEETEGIIAEWRMETRTFPLKPLKAREKPLNIHISVI